ncbi:cell division protein CrgA [Microbacterium sp. BWT-B31]|uniref:cell division protein CrgA n=1 Tax=Microbacterium sp. BWT-B31 TaxID=3232072 RepID=UPI003529C783
MARAGRDDDALVDRGEGDSTPNPVWFKPIMIGLMLVGLVWVLVYYLSGSLGLPIPGIGGWNLVIGFGIAFVGFLMTTRWR